MQFVALRVAEQGHFTLAMKAASRIPIMEAHDEVKIEILRMRDKQETGTV